MLQFLPDNLARLAVGFRQLVAEDVALPPAASVLAPESVVGEADLDITKSREQT